MPPSLVIWRNRTPSSYSEMATRPPSRNVGCSWNQCTEQPSAPATGLLEVAAVEHALRRVVGDRHGADLPDVARVAHVEELHAAGGRRAPAASDLRAPRAAAA